MITITPTQLWWLAGIWLFVGLMMFLFGSAATSWWNRKRLEKIYADIDKLYADLAVQSIELRRPPAGQALPRSGRLALEDDPTAIDIKRHWPALEREVTPETRTFSHVQVSNWERNLQRRQRQWEHDNGLDEVWLRDVQ